MKNLADYIFEALKYQSFEELKKVLENEPLFSEKNLFAFLERCEGYIYIDGFKKKENCMVECRLFGQEVVLEIGCKHNAYSIDAIYNAANAKTGRLKNLLA